MPVPVWQIPLDQPPQIVAIGRHAHGFVPNDRYRLEELWSLHLYGYEAQQRLDGEEVVVRPGTLGITPPGVLMETWYAGVSVHLFAHFRLAPGAPRTVAATTELGDEYPLTYQDLYDAVLRFSTEPAWAAAKVWNVLWKAVALSEAPRPERTAPHPAVRRAVQIVGERLGAPMGVAELARRVDVAPDYLTRLFRQTFGETVAEYVRRRRMERASELLLHSSLPIKIVASTVGFADLQQFNKAVRAYFGVAPREYRVQGGTTSRVDDRRTA